MENGVTPKYLPASGMEKGNRPDNNGFAAMEKGIFVDDVAATPMDIVTGINEKGNETA